MVSIIDRKENREVLRQTSSHAAGQVSVGPFHFR